MRSPLLLLFILHVGVIHSHPVDRVSWHWSNTTTKCVDYCEKIVDGPMAANGDMGIVIGGKNSLKQLLFLW